MATTESALSDADAALTRLADAVGRIGDGDLHRAHRGGGWTVAQVATPRSRSPRPTGRRSA